MGVTVGETVISALGFADDIILMADSPEKLQALIDITGNWSIRNHMSFNKKKCKVLVLNAPKKDLNFTLFGTSLALVNKITYLGVRFSRSRLTSLYTSHFREVIGKAETRLNTIRHLGFHSDGLRPVTQAFVGICSTGT